MTHQGIREALDHHPFTESLQERHRAELARLAREVTFREDQIIFHVGERSRYFYLVLSGSLCIEIATPVYAVCIQAVGSGQAFGWSSLLKGHPTVFQVRARETCKVLSVDGARLAAMCSGDPAFGCAFLQRLLELVAERMTATESRLAGLFGTACQDHNGTTKPRAPACL